MSVKAGDLIRGDENVTFEKTCAIGTVVRAEGSGHLYEKTGDKGWVFTTRPWRETRYVGAPTEDVTVLWVPPREFKVGEKIEEAVVIQELPVGSVVRGQHGEIARRDAAGWECVGSSSHFESLCRVGGFPYAVIYLPGAK